MKLDKQRRLKLPLQLVESSGIDLNSELRISLLKNYFVLYNAKDFPDREYNAIVKLDYKQRFSCPKYLLELLTPSPTEFIVSVRRNEIYLRWELKEDFD